MSYAFEEITFLPSLERTAAEYLSEDFDFSKFSEIIVFLELTAQGAYTDETLNIALQTKSPNGKYHTLESFTEVGDKTAAIPFYESIEDTNIGKTGRIKATLAGTAKDFTFSVTAVAKRIT